MRSRSFTGNRYDYNTSIYNLYLLEKKGTHKIFKNKGYDQLIVMNIGTENIELFETHGLLAYHLNTYLEQIDCSHKECLHGNSKYPRFMRLENDENGHIREQAVHVVVFFTCCKDEWSGRARYSDIMNSGVYSIDHHDGNRYNFSPSNLKLLSASENRLKGGDGNNRDLIKLEEELWLYGEEDLLSVIMSITEGNK